MSHQNYLYGIMHWTESGVDNYLGIEYNNISVQTQTDTLIQIADWHTTCRQMTRQLIRPFARRRKGLAVHLHLSFFQAGLLTWPIGIVDCKCHGMFLSRLSVLPSTRCGMLFHVTPEYLTKLVSHIDGEIQTWLLETNFRVSDQNDRPPWIIGRACAEGVQYQKCPWPSIDSGSLSPCVPSLVLLSHLILEL